MRFLSSIPLLLASNIVAVSAIDIVSHYPWQSALETAESQLYESVFYLFVMNGRTRNKSSIAAEWLRLVSLFAGESRVFCADQELVRHTMIWPHIMWMMGREGSICPLPLNWIGQRYVF
jgi:hypothetical protein